MFHSSKKIGDWRMSNIFKNFLDSMKLTDEDDMNYYDTDIDHDIQTSLPLEMESNDDSYDSTPRKAKKANSKVAKGSRKERVTKMDRATSSKVVPIRSTSKGLEVCIVKPTTFEDSQIICDMLLSGRATVINLEGFDDKLAQRTMDFVSGSVYAINGKLHRISNCIFIVSPDNVDISGDYLDILEDSGFGPPTIHTQF